MGPFALMEFRGCGGPSLTAGAVGDSGGSPGASWVAVSIDSARSNSVYFTDKSEVIGPCFGLTTLEKCHFKAFWVFFPFVTGEAFGSWIKAPDGCSVPCLLWSVGTNVFCASADSKMDCKS